MSTKQDWLNWKSTAKRLALCALCSAAAVAEADDKLPLKRLVMFNSGVGFFEHHAEVEGNVAIDLKFNVDDVNDLLKSMVVEDRGGGRISTVTYGSKDPITKTLKTFAIDLTENPTLAGILGQIRGETVEIEAPNPISGVIVGVETRLQPAPKEEEPIEKEFLNLLTDSGLRSVPLESVGRIKLQDEKLDAELRQALRVLAMGHATDKKTVSLGFLGEGKRPVRVGYIQETPVWKTSYRLVLDEKEKPLLQGWAIVENTTEEDWKDVQLTLVSGRPISFTMDLYEPLYVKRPLVELERYASLRPQVHAGNLLLEAPAAADAELAALADKSESAPAAVAAKERLELRRAGANGDGTVLGRKVHMFGGAAMDPRLGVQAAAHGAEVGELFEYVIAAPVTLERQKSAMLPIVNEAAEGEKVSIYNAAVDAKHPLSGLRLKNVTKLHLMQGPITVFDGGVYAGDAKIEDISPGAERLISYAVDQDVEVAPESVGKPEQILSMALLKGTMRVSRKQARSTKYVIRNSDQKNRQVLIEHPFDPAWSLTAPKEPSEKARDRYRFAVTAEAGKPTSLAVEEEQTIEQQLAITNLNDQMIAFYISQKGASEAVKQALQEVVRRKQALQKVEEERQRLEQQVAAISQEQDRIRQNMQQLDRNSDLYKRYVKKFSDQEDSVEKMRSQIQTLAVEGAKLRQSLDEYLISLNVN